MAGLGFNSYSFNNPYANRSLRQNPNLPLAKATTVSNQSNRQDVQANNFSEAMDLLGRGVSPITFKTSGGATLTIIIENGKYKLQRGQGLETYSYSDMVNLIYNNIANIC